MEINKLFVTSAFFVCIIAFLLIFIIGCAANGPLLKPSQDSRREYVNNHPELLPEIKQSILEGKVIKGMTKEDVKASWGEPNDIKNSSNSRFYAENGEGWHYKAFFLSLEPTRFIEFKNGIVIYVSEHYK